MADLLYLIRFGLRTSWLQIENFLDLLPSEDVMVSSNPLLESKPVQQYAQRIEMDIGIGSTAKNLFEELVQADHGNFLPPASILPQMPIDVV